MKLINLLDMLAAETVENGTEFYVKYFEGGEACNYINWEIQNNVILEQGCTNFYTFLEQGVYHLNDEVVIIKKEKTIDIGELKAEMIILQSQIDQLSNEIGSLHNEAHSMRDRNNYMKDKMKEIQRTISKLEKSGE